MRVPFYINSYEGRPHTKTVFEYIVENGRYEIVVEPSWPCYKKDGAYSCMNFNLKCIFIDGVGHQYEVKEIVWED